MSEPFNPYAPPAESGAEYYPQVPAPDANLATRWRRLCGKVIDAALMLGILFVGAELADRIDLRDASFRDRLVTVLAPMMLALFALATVQWWLTATSGQTIGKKIMMTRVVKDDGTPVGFFVGVFLREWVLGLLTLVPYVGGLIWLVDSLFIIADDRKTLHDRIAGTKVIDSRVDPLAGQELEAGLRSDMERPRRRRRRRRKKAAEQPIAPAESNDEKPVE